MDKKEAKKLQDMLIKKIYTAANAISSLSSSEIDKNASMAIKNLMDSVMILDTLIDIAEEMQNE